MFYNDVLLRKGGKFYLYWLADFYPRRLNLKFKKQIWSLDIRKSCDELREVISSESGSVSKKFSLRLSSHLVRGLTRIYARKVNLFIDYLCSFIPVIYEQTNKLYLEDTGEREAPPRRKRRRVTAAPTILITANDVIDQIQNTNNMVVRLDDITIREENLPPVAVPNDGFGEELVPPEVMRAPDTSEHQVSRLELEQTDRSKDVTDLLHLTGHMEVLQEVDVFGAKKSVAGDLIIPFDLEKEIPQIPDILPEIPNDPVVIQEEIIPAQQRLEPSADFNLESLEDITEADNRRRKRRSLIVDKCTMFTGKYMRKRLENVNVEQRHVTFNEAIINLDKVSAYLLLRQPAVGNHRTRADCQLSCCLLDDLFVKNLVVSARVHTPDRQLETMLRRPNLESIVENEILQTVPPVIEEPTRIVEDSTRIVEDSTKVVEDSIRIMYSPIKHLEAPRVMMESPIKPVEGTIVIPDQDISAHQIVVTADVHQTMDKENVCPPAKKRKLNSEDKRKTRSQAAAAKRSSVQVPRSSLEKGIEAPTLPTADDLAQACVPTSINTPDIVYNDQQVDIVMREHDRVTRTSGDSNEPQLGSLDRTKVSLDNHHEDTELKRYLNEQWGSEATLIKIIKSRHEANDTPLNVHALLHANRTRLAAAKCFSSLLKLKQHNFIELVKSEDTLDITNILLIHKEYTK